MSKEITTLFEAQQRINDLERKLKSNKSKLSELEKKNNDLLKSHSEWMCIALERKDKIDELERENKQLHEDKKFYSEQWEKVSKENENIIEDIEYIIEHCANGTEYVYDELNKILTNNTNK